MAKLNGQQTADKWGRRLKAAGLDIKLGVQAVTQAPGIKAAAAKDRYLAGIQEAVSSGRWQRQVGSVSLQDWQDATINKGIGRIQQGVDSSMAKTAAVYDKVLAAIDSVNAQVQKLPNATLDDRINRMVAFARGMSQANIR